MEFKINIVDYDIDLTSYCLMPKVPNIGDGITYYPKKDGDYRRVVVEKINYHLSEDGVCEIDLIVARAELQ